MEHLRVSTITSILQISTDLDLKKIYDLTPITKYIPFIEYGSENIPKGFSKKMLRKKRKKTTKKIFYNQATLHVFHDGKIMNVKLFNNGKIQITGLKKEGQGPILIQNLIDYFYDISMFNKEVKILKHDLVLINSDFDLGFEIDREVLHNEIIESGIYSSSLPIQSMFTCWRSERPNALRPLHNIHRWTLRKTVLIPLKTFFRFI